MIYIFKKMEQFYSKNLKRDKNYIFIVKIKKNKYISVSNKYTLCILGFKCF